MIKTITIDGNTSVKIKQSPHDMDRFCRIENHSGSPVFASCVDPECTEKADGVAAVPANDYKIIDTESFETLYLCGSGEVEITTSAYCEVLFKRVKKGGDVHQQPLVLFEGSDAGYTLAVGFTGFSAYYTDTPAGADLAINQTIDKSKESKYGYRLAKAYSISGGDANYTDSAVISSNEEIDLTNYSKLYIDFYGHSDLDTTYIPDGKKMAAYFRIGRPDTLPQSDTAYDWTGWDNMFMNYRSYGRYYFDISELIGAHYLCFGIFHGNYDVGYTNGIKIYKITLM